MLKIWTSGVSAEAYLLTSASARVEMNRGALEVRDRSGIPHIIETEKPPRPVRLEIEFAASLTALEKPGGFTLGDWLLGAYRIRTFVVIMESTRKAAYGGYIDELDGKLASARGRMPWERVTAFFGVHLTNFGTYVDFDNIASVSWED